MAIVETKPAVKSTAILGGLVAMLPAFDQALVLLHLLPFPVLGEVSALLVPAIGGLLSIFGRIRAQSKIKGIF